MNLQNKLFYSEEIVASGNNLENTIRNFTSAVNTSFNFYTQTDNDTKLINLVQSGNIIELNDFITTQKPNINAISNKRGWTSLIIASKKGYSEVVELLLEKGVKLDMQTYDGWTALMLAANTDMVKLLLEKGANVNLQTNDGWSALMLATDKENVDLVRLLLEKGANVNMQNNTGWCALMDASDSGQLEIIKQLLEKGANKNLKTRSGKTAFDVAKNDSIKKLLSP